MRGGGGDRRDTSKNEYETSDTKDLKTVGLMILCTVL